VWFWDVLKSMSDADKADFLMFSTGSPLVPFGGFKNLKGPNGPKKFTIAKDYNPQHLIKAHTWYYLIIKKLKYFIAFIALIFQTTQPRKF